MIFSNTKSSPEISGGSFCKNDSIGATLVVVCTSNIEYKLIVSNKAFTKTGKFSPVFLSLGESAKPQVNFGISKIKNY